MQSRKFQSVVFALFVGFITWLIPLATSADVTFTPSAPTTSDSVQLGVTWGVPSSCYNGIYTSSVVANLIRIEISTVYTAPAGTSCAQRVINRNLNIPVGVLPAGNYSVEVYERFGTISAFQLLFTTSFDVFTSNDVAVQQDGQAVHLLVKPLPPSNYDVQLVAAWVMPSACFTSSGTTSISGNAIRADVTVISTGTTCTPQLTKGTYFSPSLGELPPGTYNIVTSFNGVPGISRQLTVMPIVALADATMSVTPTVPSSTDDVAVLANTILPSSCFEDLNFRIITVSGSDIRLDLSLVGTHAGCVQQPTPSREARFYLGKMAPGTYAVRIYYNGELGLTSSLTIKPNADLALSQSTSPNPVRRGRFVLVKIDVANNGPDAVNEAIASSVLPTNLSYVASLATQGRCSVSNSRNIKCELGALGVGVTAQIGILARARTPGTASLSSTVSSEAIDANSANDSAVSVIEVRR